MHFTKTYAGVDGVNVKDSLVPLVGLHVFTFGYVFPVRKLYHSFENFRRVERLTWGVGI